MTDSNTVEAFNALDPDLRDIITVGGHSITWDDHIGQDRAKRVLRRAAASAKKREAVMGHALLASPYAGIGKTSLAILAALEMNRGFAIVSGKVTLAEMRSVLADMEDGDVLVIDEAHLLVSGGKANSEWLLPYMQSGKLVGPMGPEDYPSVTILATTTDAGRLPGPLRERFPYAPALEPYSDDEAAQIALLHASKLFPGDIPLPSPAIAHQLAAAGANRPRVIRSLVMTLMDLAILGEVEGPDYDMVLVLEACDVTEDGLNAQAQEYLKVLHQAHGALGAAPLAERLGEKGDGLGDLERLLVDKGLIGRTQRGRELTRSGIVRAKELSRPAA